MTRHRRRAIGGAAVSATLLLTALSGLGGASAPQREPMQQVISVRLPVAAGRRLAVSDLAVSATPSRWANPHQLSDPAQAIGRSVAVDLAAGSPLMDSELVNPEVAGARDVSLRLDDTSGLPIDPPDGGRADIYLVTPGPRSEVSLVLAGVLVVATRSADGAAVATLRVVPADVPALIRAEAAGSLRLVARTRS